MLTSSLSTPASLSATTHNVFFSFHSVPVTSLQRRKKEKKKKGGGGGGGWRSGEGGERGGGKGRGLKVQVGGRVVQ